MSNQLKPSIPLRSLLTSGTVTGVTGVMGSEGGGSSPEGPSNRTACLSGIQGFCGGKKHTQAGRFFTFSLKSYPNFLTRVPDPWIVWSVVSETQRCGRTMF